MTRRRLLSAGLIAIVVILGFVIRNQVKVNQNRQARAALFELRHPVVPEPIETVRQRQALFDALRPVAIAGCELERFGEANDGGYLMCANLLGGVLAGYSYGIAGYDRWGCDISTRLDVPVHQYDCFNTTQPSCFFGETVFHAECVGTGTETIDGRPFDTVLNQLKKNGDSSKRIVLKMDVEGAEWDSLLTAPDAVLHQIDQLSVEFHWEEDEQFQWIQDERHLRLVERLKQFFEIVHIHFNNASCVGNLAPFPSWAYEVLFVSKRLARIDPAGAAVGLHPSDARNNASLEDCQPAAR